MWTDELTRRYAAADVCEGGKQSVLRPSAEGSTLLLRAAACLRTEAIDEGLRLAERSVSVFRQCGDSRGLADAARLVSCAMIHQDRRKEADRLLRDELAVFQTSARYTSKSAEARILQAMADVSSDRRGQKKRAEALKAAGQARDLAVDEADKGLEASTLAVMAKIFIKFKGDRRACDKEGHRLATQALELFRETQDVRGQAIAAQHSAVAQCNLQEFVPALQSLQAAIGFWKQSEDAMHQAHCLVMMAEWLLHWNQPTRAGPAADQALALYNSHGISGQRATKALQLAVRAQISNGEPWRAIWTSEDAVARSREKKDQRGEAKALLCLAEGYTCSPSGREQQEAPASATRRPPPEDAVAAMQKALQIANGLNDETLEAEVMTKLSSMHVKRIEMEEAIFAAHDALSHRDVKDPVGKGQAFQSLAAAHLHNKDFATAERAARAARDICRKDGRWQGDAAGVMSMAEVLLAEQKIDDAVDLAKEAQSLYSEHHDRRGEAKALIFVAKARMSSEEYEKACFAAERAHELFARLRDEEGKCEALVLAAQCRIQLLQRQQKQSSAKLKGKKASLKAPLPWEDLSKASKASTQAREAAKKLGDPKAEAAALCALAQIYIFNGRPQTEIFNTLDEALFVAAEAEDPKSEGTALLLQAQMHLEASELQSALKAARQAQLIVDKSGDAAQKSQVESILDQLRGHEFRVDEAPRIDPRMVVGQMALPMVSGPDPAVVRATIQEVTKKMVGSGNDIEADMPLMDIGINSMNAVLFRNKLITEFKDVELPTTLVFDYPTVKTLSGLVVEQVTQAATAAQQQAMAAAMPMMAMPGTGYPVIPQPGVTPIEVASKIQEVTKGMVGSDRDIDADMPLMDIGINSMNAVLFRNKLGSAFEGVELPNTLVFDYPTVKDLSELLMMVNPTPRLMILTGCEDALQRPDHDFMPNLNGPSKEASRLIGEPCLALHTVVRSGRR
ncbi:Polyketide synthase PksJ [Symbiodinium microadriaticum]|uniref:Tetratricopeptide repeat protein 29 n=1 Tax=Symbiodinium microadriaticum TaxID=2951 RepID=A0A1Q9CX38_SYMMI|nr:Polyketide synthase PksJ [Symbiodinium microadriaticum]